MDKEEKLFNKFCAALEPADQKNFRELLDILHHTINFTIKIGDLNKDYLKIFKECSTIIVNQFDEKTGWNKDEIFQNYHIPFEKICLEYDAVNADVSKQFKEWNESRSYCKTVFTMIIKKKKNDKVIKGINILLQNYKKQTVEMKKYYEKILDMHGKMTEFKKRVDVFKN